MEWTANHHEDQRLDPWVLTTRVISAGVLSWVRNAWSKAAGN